ncbi:lymphatic vessel endothelial hyaluronic acid receptor 1-like isoform X2 [Scyliorhinus canicula]|uniref:lymphatic vessel endothelial hyaluronic acid receptor 1-like isoform X2 n=1 Tax=Scyliorhinus canicula TaxID=7830 RepID=UPI0018F54A05|nr:lymphatic vessel endothelial hyaluronic acid receptor 1-like isoform X2 [Scyliorhinus canicula]
MKEWGVLTLIALSQTFLVLTQTSIDVNAIEYSNCRILGVFHIRLEDEYKLSQAQARNACNSLGTQLATRLQVELAQGQGFEKCRFGWVDDGFVVIPRVSSKEQCGKNTTGVLIWKVESDKLYDGYCFQKNDAHKTNTCEPLMKQTRTAAMHPTKTSLIDLGSINTNMATEFSSETMPVPDAKTTHVSWETNSFLSTSISTAARSTSSSEFLNTSMRGEDHKLTSNGVIYWDARRILHM